MIGHIGRLQESLGVFPNDGMLPLAQRSNEDRVRKNSAGVVMRSPVRFATAWLKCLVLCVNNQSGPPAIAERSMGTSAACRIK